MKSSLALLIALLGVLLSPLSAQPPAEKKTPLGVPADATRFNGKWYRVYLEKKVPWKAAKEKCEHLGGQLAVVHDEATQAFIVKLANGLSLWLGATDEQVEGLWVWVDGTPMTYRAFFPGEPNGNRKANWLHTWRGGRWADSTMAGPVELVGYICEWKAQ